MRIVPQIDNRWWGQLDKKVSERPADLDTFRTRFMTALNEINQTQVTADQAALRLATGEANDLSEVMIATEKANLSLLLATRVRNQAIDAYREIMRMQV